MYIAWSNPVSNNCALGCTAGFVLTNGQCSTCGTGFWVSGGLCTPCTNKATHGYYLTPTGFNQQSNSCPWDCGAGYFRDGEFCTQCAVGIKFSLAISQREGQELNQCKDCRVCGSGSYQSAACTVSSDTVCTSCAGQCAPGNYVSRACTSVVNQQCSPCRTSCGQDNYIRTACNPSATSDTTVCASCLTADQCLPGTYLPRRCGGTESQKNTCQAGFHSL